MLNDRRLPPFTPVMDCLLREEGVSGREVLVFGVIWRYSNDLVFDRSQQFIANALDIDRKTVFRAIKSLVEIRFIDDLTLRNSGQPKKYQITQLILRKIENYLYQNVSGELRVRRRLPVISQEEAINMSILMAEVEAEKLRPESGGFSAEQLEFIAIAEKLRELRENVQTS